MPEQSRLSEWILDLKFKKKYFCASQPHSKQALPLHFLSLKKSKI
jgi:hypothetical protein